MIYDGWKTIWKIPLLPWSSSHTWLTCEDKREQEGWWLDVHNVSGMIDKAEQVYGCIVVVERMNSGTSSRWLLTISSQYTPRPSSSNACWNFFPLWFSFWSFSCGRNAKKSRRAVESVGPADVHFCPHFKSIRLSVLIVLGIKLVLMCFFLTHLWIPDRMPY